MRKIFGLFTTILFLHGCATVPQESNTPTDDIATAGIPLCQPNEQCPILSARWNPENKDQLRINVRLNSSYLYYDIKKVIFIVDGKHLAYKPAQPTVLRSVSRLEPRRSSNYILVPSSFLTQFKNAKSIDIQINTDHGPIKRAMYKDGQQSSAYKNFIDVYNKS
ncbi:MULTISPECIES: hypothetical protein [Acinetobacter]|uniref:Uncharacterized protein n=1 Tax=Acinetobacter baylyi (strain ATCC 33305 / BD413 / ADP1) TaxID=62977 RepID=Q6FAR3_ACIAD|nr:MULTISPECIES: hypothetical protein [Acinetobacter]ENV53782.1 hypothetical protein F952_01834 [Acinetobacter baylyi DSM 14961 = CIP 107474]KAF2373241.1 hypothetical protein BSL88_00985 [Acinetobacter baylyi]KAF2374342.1 hypothetical protein BSL67_06935 [Acinetobacter baylyi]KAF2378761.1 hypothetical protein BSN81_01085 [Acinetobacter baylyi]KAF2381075.1 hypothetical protein BSN83_08070 [Acinetobacter baylyi]